MILEYNYSSMKYMFGGMSIKIREYLTISMVQAWSAVTRRPVYNAARVHKAWRETVDGADPSPATDDPAHKVRN